MSCYVDELQVSVSTNPGARSVGERTGHQWCHLWADTNGELHAMASQLGLKPKWFQPGKRVHPYELFPSEPDFPHYDLTPGMRLRAIANGAQEKRLRDLAEIRLRQGIVRREMKIEWEYRFAERIAILCGTDTPTAEQIELASREAHQWLDSQANK